MFDSWGKNCNTDVFSMEAKEHLRQLYYKSGEQRNLKRGYFLPLIWIGKMSTLLDVASYVSYICKVSRANPYKEIIILKSEQWQSG